MTQSEYRSSEPSGQPQKKKLAPLFPVAKTPLGRVIGDPRRIIGHPSYSELLDLPGTDSRQAIAEQRETAARFSSTLEALQAFASDSGDACTISVETSSAPLGNTGPITRQPLETGGVDTLHATIWGNWEWQAWASVRTQLSTAKNCAIKDDQAGTMIDGPLGPMQVLRHEVKKAGGRQHYAWALKTAFGSMLIADTEREIPDGPPQIVVELGSLALMQHGPHELWAAVRQFLSSIGFTETRNQITRIDVAADGLDLTAEQLREMGKTGHIVCRAKGVTMHAASIWDDAETITIGFGHNGKAKPHQLCLYNKRSEVIAKGDDDKRQVLEAKRWTPGGGTMRCEMRFLREGLRETHKIDTVEQALERLPWLLHWATNHWFRVMSHPVDKENRNQTRGTIHSMWAKVQDAFKTAVGACPTKPVPLERKPVSIPNDRRLKVAFGSISSFLAHSNARIRDGYDVALALGTIAPLFQDDVALATRTKQAILNTQSGFHPEPFQALAAGPFLPPPQSPQNPPTRSTQHNRNTFPAAARAAEFDDGRRPPLTVADAWN